MKKGHTLDYQEPYTSRISLDVAEKKSLKDKLIKLPNIEGKKNHNTEYFFIQGREFIN